MVEDLFKISLTERSAGFIDQARFLSPQLSKELKNIAFNAIDSAGTLALNAARSAVPIDTQELRNQIITKANPSSSARLPQSTIFVAQVTHMGRDNKPIDAGKLADLLNIGMSNSGKPLKRSQISNAVGGFPSYSGYTKDWITKAENNFLKRLPALLNKDFNY